LLLAVAEEGGTGHRLKGNDASKLTGICRVRELKVNNQTAPTLIKIDLQNALILHASITVVDKINK
jgi:hypothetical protein